MEEIQTSAKYTLKKQNLIGWLSIITDRKEEVLVQHRQSIIALASRLAPSWLNRVVSRHIFIYEFLVSTETVVLRRWERSKQKFGFIKRVDKGRIITVKDLES